jgi:hypothetical protein
MEHSISPLESDFGSGHGEFSSGVRPFLGSTFSGSGLSRNLKQIQYRTLANSQGTRAKRRARNIIKAITYNGKRDSRNRSLLFLERAWPNPNEKPKHAQFKDVYSIASCEGTQFAAIACVKIALESMDVVVPTSDYLRHIKVDLPLKKLKRFFLRTVKQVRLNITITDPSLRSVVQGSNLDKNEIAQKNHSEEIIDLAVSRLDILGSIRQLIYKNVRFILQSGRLESYHMKTVVSAAIYHTAKQSNTSVTQQMICEALDVSTSFRTIRPLIAELIPNDAHVKSRKIESSSRKVMA